MLSRGGRALMKRFGTALLIGVCAFAGGLSAVLLTGNGGFAWARYGDRDDHDVSARFEAVATKTAPAVVALEAVKPSLKDKSGKVDDSGSGVMVNLPGKKGVYVLTNYHVI